MHLAGLQCYRGKLSVHVYKACMGHFEFNDMLSGVHTNQELASTFQRTSKPLSIYIYPKPERPAMKGLVSSVQEDEARSGISAVQYDGVG